MMSVLGRQISCTATTITIGITQDTLPSGASDYVYLATSYVPTEPATTPYKTLTTSGNTSLILDGLKPGMQYWVSIYRHDNGTITKWSYIVDTVAQNPRGETDYHTLELQTVAKKTSSTFVEDWSHGLTNWVDEHAQFMDLYQLTSDADLGNVLLANPRYRNGSYPGGVLNSRIRWDEHSSFDVSWKVKGMPAITRDNWGTLTLLSSEAEYAGWNWGQGEGNTDLYTMVYTSSSGSNHLGVYLDPGTIYTMRITYNGAGTWNFYLDGVLKRTATWQPHSAFGLWMYGPNAAFGPLTVIGTPVFWMTGDQHVNKRFKGNHSVRTAYESPISGTAVTNYGGITAPNTIGQLVTPNEQDTYTTDRLTYAAGNFSCRTPNFYCTPSALRFAGAQVNGSISLTVKKSSDDTVLAGPWYPTSNTEVSQSISTITNNFYLEINGSVTTEGSTASIINYITLDATDPASDLDVNLAEWWQVTGVTLNTNGIILAPAATSQLTTTIAPSNATNKSVTWSSSAPSIATVDSTGLVTAVANGTTTITVTTTDGRYTDTCVVTVSSGTVFIPKQHIALGSF